MSLTEEFGLCKKDLKLERERAKELTARLTQAEEQLQKTRHHIQIQSILMQELEEMHGDYKFALQTLRQKRDDALARRFSVQGYLPTADNGWHLLFPRPLTRMLYSRKKWHPFRG